MSILIQPGNPGNPINPEVLQPGCSPCSPYRNLDPKAPETWDYGFHRLMPLLQSPPVGAGIIAITFFFLVLFFSNVLLYQVTYPTLGIVVTLGTLGILALLVLILFIV